MPKKKLSRNGANCEFAFPPNLLSCSKTPSKLQYKSPTELVESLVWTVDEFLTPDECSLWIDYVESESRLELMQQRGTRVMAMRECYRFSGDDVAMAERLFHRLQQTRTFTEILRSKFSGEEPITCNPNIRLYKYGKGMSFGKHVDGSHLVAGRGETRMTMLVYLSQCQGGATRFHDDEGVEVAYEPRVGSLLLHVHGDECLEHEADPVVKGIKYVLRTDLVYSRS